MEGVRRGARAVLRYFVPLIGIAIVAQIILAGEGIFRLKNIEHSDDCNKHGAHCVANSTALDPHRGLGFILTEPVAILLLVVALLAWHPVKRVRTLTLILPFWLFFQAVLAFAGKWTGWLHPLNAFFLLAAVGWLSRTLWEERRAGAPAPVPATVEAA